MLGWGLGGGGGGVKRLALGQHMDSCKGPPATDQKPWCHTVAFLPCGLPREACAQTSLWESAVPEHDLTGFKNVCVWVGVGV